MATVGCRGWRALPASLGFGRLIVYLKAKNEIPLKLPWKASLCNYLSLAGSVELGTQARKPQARESRGLLRLFPSGPGPAGRVNVGPALESGR